MKDEGSKKVGLPSTYPSLSPIFITILTNYLEPVKKNYHNGLRMLFWRHYTREYLYTMLERVEIIPRIMCRYRERHAGKIFPILSLCKI